MNGSASPLGGVAQASLPAVYAWAVTVAPVAWGRGGSLVAQALALAALAALAFAFYLDARGAQATRPVLVWGFVVPSALTWIATPAGFSPARWDLARGIGGMLGWGLFALAAASATRAAAPVNGVPRISAPNLRPRRPPARGDALVLVVVVLAACSLQAIGWTAPFGDPARRILVRAVTVAAALLLLASSGSVLVARHARRQRRPARARLRASLPWLALFVVLAAAALVVRLLR